MLFPLFGLPTVIDRLLILDLTLAYGLLDFPLIYGYSAYLIFFYFLLGSLH